MNWMVDVERRFGSAGSTTLPAEIVPVPVLAAAAEVREGRGRGDLGGVA